VRTPPTAAHVSVLLMVCMFVLGTVAQVRANDALSLRATAGLGGLVKSGRWVPVQIRITDAGTGVLAPAIRDIVVTWGDVVVRRAVALAPASAFDLELYTRTTEPTAVIRVEVAGTAARTEVPVTVVPHGTPVTVCVVPPDQASTEDVGCSVTLTPRQLPVSARAYEVADQVVTASGFQSIPAPQRRALAVWRALHPLETSGDLSLTPQVTRPAVARGLPAATATAVTWTVIAYVAMILATGFFVATRRFRAPVAWLAFAGVVGSGLAATMAVGRFGPGSELTVHHTSLLQQIPDTNNSLLTTRGIAEFPSEGDARLRLAVQDGSVEGAVPVGRAELLIDEGGFPVLSGYRGMGSRQSFTSEAVIEQQLLIVAEDGERVQVVNATDSTLRGCRFGDGVSPSEVGDLSPGARAQGLRTGEVIGPLVWCTTSAASIPLASSSHRVQLAGTTTVVAYRRRIPASSGAPND
jgi:hypothetical protein